MIVEEIVKTLQDISWHDSKTRINLKRIHEKDYLSSVLEKARHRSQKANKESQKGYDSCNDPYSIDYRSPVRRF